MKTNYFTVHKNKKPKKAKYSKPYSKLKLQKMEECTQYFINEIKKLKQNGTSNSGANSSVTTKISGCFSDNYRTYYVDDSGKKHYR